MIPADGYADQSNVTAGALTVYLQGVPAGAPYWIFQLGPPTYGSEGLYQYSVVSDPFQLSLFVLARNVTEFYQQYDLPLRNWLNASGWNTVINTPLATVQRGCTYW
jgi:lipocalin